MLDRRELRNQAIGGFVIGACIALGVVAALVVLLGLAEVLGWLAEVR